MRNIRRRYQPPRKQTFFPFGAEEFLADQKFKNLPGEELGQPRVVDPEDLMENPGLIHSTLSITPGISSLPATTSKITVHGPESTAAEFPQ